MIHMSIVNTESLPVFQMIDKGLVEFGLVEEVVFDFEFDTVCAKSFCEEFVVDFEEMVDFRNLYFFLGTQK